MEQERARDKLKQLHVSCIVVTPAPRAVGRASEIGVARDYTVAA